MAGKTGKRGSMKIGDFQNSIVTRTIVAINRADRMEARA